MQALEKQNIVWYRPCKILYFSPKGKEWKQLTQYGNLQEKINRYISYGYSPLDKNGNAYFIAWDLDSGNWNDVNRIINQLKGMNYLVSQSGMKGYHVWVFPDKPISGELAYNFADCIRKKAGLPETEIFPSSKSKDSKCIKFPGSYHPITGIQEVFIHTLSKEKIQDTKFILNSIAQGMFRTPIKKIKNYLSDNLSTIEKKSQQVIENDSQIKTRPTKKAEKYSFLREILLRFNSYFDRPLNLIENHLELFKQEDIGFRIMALFGKRVRTNELGKAFCCPIHPEKHPSANFYMGDNGYIVFFDRHKKQKDEVFIMPEFFLGLLTGELRKMDKITNAMTGEIIVLLLGFGTELAIQQQKVFTQIKLPDDLPEEIYLIWQTVKLISLIQATAAGYEELQLSKRFLSAITGIPEDKANRSLNLLVTLGVLEKIHGKPGQANRFKLKQTNKEAIQSIWEQLGKPGLSRFKGGLVKVKLGDKTFKEIFVNENQEEEREEEKHRDKERPIALNDGEVINLCDFTGKQEEKEEEYKTTDPQDQERKPDLTDEMKEFIKQVKSGEYRKTLLDYFTRT